ncbi:hypothetical protein [Polaromonas sp. AER18D-145]|uniref:hypothetical protein n=1 Tax=Polaromonas sp. AER18D-145 TaxID=1977060 RepID=UPI000BBC2DC2|nr:hypothetical protein [Polaromonas sp. AER18D-145]
MSQETNSEKVEYMLRGGTLAEALTYHASPETATRRAQLLALPIEDIDRLCAAEFDAQRKRTEQGRFYNQWQAEADYETWARLDHWSPDEAVALLLGKNPDVVSWGSLKDYRRDDELAEGQMQRLGIVAGQFNASRYLVTRYLDFAFILSRAEVFIPVGPCSFNVDPVAALNCARAKNIPIPAPLEAALAGRKPRPVQTLATAPAAVVTPEPQREPVVFESASDAPASKVWTDERKADARAYREKHGLKKTAEYYRVSQATISKHIPAEKEKPTVLGPWGGLRKK